MRNEQTHDELRTLGGQDQIPFPVDHQRNVTIYQSGDIVDECFRARHHRDDEVEKNHVERVVFERKRLCIAHPCIDVHPS